MEQDIQSVETSLGGASHSPPPEVGPGRIEVLLPIEPAARVPLAKVILACAGAMVLPGLGHLLIGRWGRALVLMISIVGMFAIGFFWMMGHLYPPELTDPSYLNIFGLQLPIYLSIFPFLANAGIGGIYGLCYYLHVGFEVNPAVPTYEFGNTFLFVAGLLNYLVILDAFDIAAGRKR
jgi:hypothetical protein